jgi:hypothetical protein
MAGRDAVHISWCDTRRVHACIGRSSHGSGQELGTLLWTDVERLVKCTTTFAGSRGDCVMEGSKPVVWRSTVRCPVRRLQMRLSHVAGRCTEGRPRRRRLLPWLLLLTRVVTEQPQMLIMEDPRTLVSWKMSALCSVTGLTTIVLWQHRHHFFALITLLSLSLSRLV